MKKYYPVDFDEKGNAVLGTPKNKPTSNGFIPTTWAPGGEAGNGIKSITIAPAITTDPALESFFPIYYEDLTAEQKEDGVFLSVNHQSMGEKNVSVTPTDNWYAAYTNEDEEFIIGGKGETIVIPISLSNDGSVDELQLQFSNGNTPETVTEYFSVNIEFHYA